MWCVCVCTAYINEKIALFVPLPLYQRLRAKKLYQKLVHRTKNCSVIRKEIENMLQVQIFKQYDHEEKLQNEINAWLADHPQVVVKNIKFNASCSTDEYDVTTVLSALVMYEAEE